MKVRKAGLDDLELITELYKQDGRKTIPNVTRYPLIDWIMKGPHLILIAEDREPAGFMIIRLKGDEASVDVLSVKKGYRGKIEHDFLKQALDYVSCQRLYILVSERASSMLKAFSGIGFEVYDNVPNAFGPGRHGIKLVKQLSGASQASGNTRMIGGGVYKKPGKGYLEINLKELDFAD